eukprot:TRINITY_DN15455_c0_g1::TRINITY_DN15455_c0_g1_i1::g.30439::m.30439 TRINITY_DN15455_c0_g1::TRINITY_DN15455_c0_g1_i1::g.30439  ORF type:complete len:529 (+),score=98.44,sp/Q8VBW6/ULA1_MOUSE/47.86/2e-178,ThiF/PF00899.16/1.3e-09,ThiF/PF00899.16/8.6e+03,DUF4404/PF14357.1/0.91,DUF4404/PF14357.1/6.3e+03 TRINITY_DN15455_c0_g1_i1:109-1695(+)
MAQDSKTQQKYDRQIRIWGDHGQAKLQAATVCLLGANATGTETLKNLVLPGVGGFVIVDDALVTDADLGNNFFLTVDGLGKPRSQVACEHLQELNPSVNGSFLVDNVLSLLDKDPDYFNNFALVIASNLPERPLLRVAEVLWTRGIPLLHVRSYGLVASLRVCVPEHTIIESKPDVLPDDLRLAAPWPELVEFATKFDLTTQDEMKRSHIPFAVILLKFAEDWKAVHGGRLPTTRDEKNTFKKALRDAKLKEEENFEEAVRNAHRVFAENSPKVPSVVQTILDDPKATHITDTSPNFWILASALRAFVANEGHGLLPVSGAVPDMHADTESYIALQTIYREKADRDTQCVLKHVQHILSCVGKQEDSISVEDVQQFCRNASMLHVLRYRSLANEYSADTTCADDITRALETPDSAAVWYILMRAAKRFHDQRGRYPGILDQEMEEDIAPLKAEVSNVLTELGASNGLVSDDCVMEMCRFGASELHTIAAFIGGVAAQEATKLITSQFVPLEGVFVFNGISGASVTIKL